MRFFNLRRKKDGKEFTISENDVDGTLKQGFEMIGEIKQEEEVKVEELKKEQTFQCPLCGFQTRFEHALGLHKGRMHK